MKIPLSWLQRWLDTPAPLVCEELCQALTFSGLEVDGVEQQGVHSDKLVVGEVQSCQGHPQADSLHLCRVDSGQGVLQIVCGAHNVRAGLKVALALPGVRIEGKKLKKSKLRGIESQGMMCSERELGLGGDHSGIIELAAEAQVGEPLHNWLAVSDYIIDINITPNRGDCLSILGVARDLAASRPEWRLRALAESKPPISHGSKLPIKLSEPELCPKFCGCVIKGVDLAAPTPEWLRNRLLKAGMRCIDAAVDITNYVMLELGQPAHAYDLAQISGGIEVRSARAGESLLMIDNSEQKLDQRDLLIADDTKVLGLAGVMGGKYSGISAATKDIFLEAAWFHPRSVHGQARRRDINSEAAYRFERGVDYANTEAAMRRAVALFVDITGGQAGEIVTTSVADSLPQTPTIELSLTRAQRLLGLTIGDGDLRGDHIQAYLQSLGCLVETGEVWRVRPPSYRPDLQIEADLLEEIARIHGYENIPEKLPAGGQQLSADFQPSTEPERLQMALMGYQENINFSFVSVEQERATRPTWAAEAIQISNPLTDGFTTMRSSLIGGLLQSAQANLARQRERVRFFECGRVFWQGEDGSYYERDHLAALSIGNSLFAQDWQASKLNYGFYDLKAEVLALADLQFVAAETPQAFLHPGKSASLLDAQAQEVGFCGLLHPEAQRTFGIDLEREVWLFELRQAAVASVHRPVRYSAISDQPLNYRDLALLVPEATSYQELRACIVRAAGKYLKSLELFDYYQGQQVRSGFYSLAVRLSWQHPSKSLSFEQIAAYQDKLLAELKNLGVELRA